jgi:hypothetical protein
MKTRTLLLSLMTLVAAAACGGVDPEYKADVEKLEGRTRPWIERFKVIQGAIPAPGSEQEIAVPAGIDTQKILFIDERVLDHLTDKKPLEGDAFTEASWLATMDLHKMIPSSRWDAMKKKKDQNALHGGWDPVNALDASQHLIVARSIVHQEAKVGQRVGANEFVMERPGIWKGWIFVHELSSGKLVAAFQAESGTSDEVSARQTAGTQFNEMWLRMNLWENFTKMVRARLGG